ncbi:histidine phosphatase family protein [Bacillus sp. 3103sda1]|uniref:histidine phosphatase family protein n=1 Tax=Bacillus sp. 3103sda1 TaxID=2953808 RepID=UPI00209C9367|nr:phosphoglycerate mutase family protein [Bacillus sp. 3103sda1]MCP1125259.1 histidine phosphatase family protein [Bacillus sp. 3103sda1]
MKLIFVRHGEGDHTKDLPNSLRINHPILTDRGEEQAVSLRGKFPLRESDILITSPTVRTLQTAALWSGQVACMKIAHPYISPRIFPYREGARTLPCDQMLSQNNIQQLFPEFLLAEERNEELWSNGINTISEFEFCTAAHSFIEWCKTLQVSRVIIVSHDGTITAYRQYVMKQVLTREDFLEETGMYEIQL